MSFSDSPESLRSSKDAQLQAILWLPKPVRVLESFPVVHVSVADEQMHSFDGLEALFRGHR